MNSLIANKSNLRNVLAFITITLSMLILPFAFVEEKIARVIFYWCGYFAFIGLIYEIFFTKTKMIINQIALSFFALGLLFIIWSIISNIYDQQNQTLLITAGKRMLLACFIMSYITQLFRDEVYSSAMLAKFALASVITAFVAATLYGVVQGLTEHHRIVLGNNRATLTAYAYSALSLALATTLLQMKPVKGRSLLFVTISLLSIYVVCLTETRAAIVIHTVLMAVLALRFFRFSRNPVSLFFILLAIIIGLAANLNIIENRVESTLSEYHQYQNNDDKTSLGARFTMWKVGRLAFEKSPLGQTQHTRNQYIRTLLNAENNQNSAALNYLDEHLHNEFIQYASVFGITGIVLLAFFYFSAIVKSAKSWGIFNPITIAVTALMLYGMTDVTLTSVEMIVIISVLLTLMTIITEDKKSTASLILKQ